MSRQKRILVESKATTIELSIAKCLSSAKLRPEELMALEALTRAELIVEYGLAERDMRKVTEHVKLERQRLNFQSQYTPDAAEQGFERGPGGYTRTSPLNESILKRKIRRLVENHFSGPQMMSLEPISHVSDEGHMLDYGMQMSDSDEGRMFRQVLHNIASDSQELRDSLTDHDDLPQWCHYKVAEAQAAISKVRDYLLYKIDNPEDPWKH